MPVLRTCQTTLCHSFAPQLWALLPTLPTACVVAETPPSPFPTTPSLTTSSQTSSHSAHPTPSPRPPLSTPFIYPTSVGNRITITAVQTVLSSEYAQTPVTLSSGQLEAILRIPLTPSPSMPVVGVITLRSDVSTNVYRQHHASPLPHRPLSPPPLSQPAPTSPRPPLLLLPRSSASPLLPLSTAKPKESELCSSTRSQPLTFSKLPSQTATRYHCREGLRYFSEQERLVHLEGEQQQDGHLHVLFRRGPQGRFSFGW